MPDPRPVRLAIVAGTRPECLKLASLVRALRARPEAEVVLINSGQHLDMVERTFAHVGIATDIRLPPPNPPLSLSRAVRHLRDSIGAELKRGGYDAIVVQGDTSTAYAGALAGRAAGIKVLHVEAGLRTSDPMRPFPEEMFRRRIAPLAAWHFAPTLLAATNLHDEGIAPERVFTVGNTIVDELRDAINVVPSNAGASHALDWRTRFSRLIVLTLHRRENYGRGLIVVCAAMLELLELHEDVGVVCPVHPNPVVGHRVRRMLGGHPRVMLTDPLDYRPFVGLLAEATLVVTDSGGIQEEAPYLGVPVLVARDSTERPEALALGTTRLVAVEHHHIVDEVTAALSRARRPRVAFDGRAPYGDGRSGERIAGLALERLTAHDAPRVDSNTRLDAAARLRRWLLDGPAQLRDGPEAGGVAGTFGADGAPSYVYGEITGYFLHWLADGTDTPAARAAARAAVEWATRRYGGGVLPPTRIYLAEAPADDWRNRAQFFFDLAMLVGGLARAARAGLIDPPNTLLSRLGSKLARFVQGGRIVAMRADEGAELPQRWSTLGGAFEAKAASRVLMAQGLVALPAALVEACEREIEAVGASAAQAPVDMLHPTLYAIEGALCGGDPNIRAGLSRWLARLLALENGRGELPESPDGEPVWRSDVIAQALRVGLALGTDAAALDRLADALVARVRPDGAIAFRPDADPPQLNTWCAMFAEQALRWHAADAAIDARAIV